MNTRLRIQKKLPSQSTYIPVQNLYQTRSFGIQQKPSHPSSQQGNVNLDEQSEQSQHLGHNLLNIPVNAPGTEPPPPIQTKLTIGQPGDKYEQEADQVASEVVQQINSPVSDQSAQGQTVQRQEAAPEEEEKVQGKSISDTIQRVEEEEPLQGKSISNTIQRVEEEEPLQGKSLKGGMAATPNLENSIQGARGSGQPLDENIRQPMEKAFGGVDFSQVKVHNDAQSDQLNQSIQARAFTTGQDVFFRGGEYNPGSRGGQELIAHELTHVVQQTGAIQRKVKTGTPSSRTLDFITMKRKHIQLKGDDKYGHWWTEIDSNESYGWWPKYPVGGIKQTLFGVDGELNGMTSFGGSATQDPHHGDSAPDVFHPVYTGTKTDTQIKADIRSFASSYSGEWRWTFGFGQNCHTFQESLMKSVGIKQS